MCDKWCPGIGKCWPHDWFCNNSNTVVPDFSIVLLVAEVPIRQTGSVLPAFSFLALLSAASAPCMSSTAFVHVSFTSAKRCFWVLLDAAVVESAHKAVSKGLVSELTAGCESAEFSDILRDSFSLFLSASVELVPLCYDLWLQLEVVLQHLH